MASSDSEYQPSCEEEVSRGKQQVHTSCSIRKHRKRVMHTDHYGCLRNLLLAAAPSFRYQPKPQVETPA